MWRSRTGHDIGELEAVQQDAQGSHTDLNKIRASLDIRRIQPLIQFPLHEAVPEALQCVDTVHHEDRAEVRQPFPFNMQHHTKLNAGW
jgi:hypothetical protein